MNSFGASGPAPELYKHFGITSEAVVNAAKNNYYKLKLRVNSKMSKAIKV